MSTCEIKPQNNERCHIRKFVEGTNLRHFEQCVVRRIQERLVKNPAVEKLSKNIDLVGQEVGGSSRISEMISNLPMILGGGLTINFKEISPKTLTQEIAIKIDHKKLQSNLNIYVAGELLRKANAKHEYLAFLHNLHEEPTDSGVYLYVDWKEVAGEISCEVTNLEEIQLGNSWAEFEINKICDVLTKDFNEVISYLQGRVAK